jgi:DNA-binding ferritin-like protein
MQTPFRTETQPPYDSSHYRRLFSAPELGIPGFLPGRPTHELGQPIDEPAEQDDRPLQGPDGSAIRTLLLGLAAFQRELLYQAHAIHLNLTGPNFLPLHALFKSEYEQLLEQFDTSAEFLRILDVTFPLTAQALRLALTSDFLDLEDVDTSGMLMTYHENLKRLVIDASCVEHCAAEEQMIDIANTMAEFVGTANKTAWMLRSMLCACAD